MPRRARSSLPAISICLFFVLPGAYAQDDVTVARASMRLEQLLAQRRDGIYAFLQRKSGEQVETWLDTVFFAEFHPTCPDGCPRLDAAAQRAMTASLLSSADAGRPAQQFELAMQYLGGLAVDRDIPQGLNWLKKAATAGYARAELCLARLYEAGVVLPADESQAIRLYEAVAKDPLWAQLGMQRLGQIYEFGTGVAPDPDRALEWLKRAEDDYDRQQRDFLPDPAAEDMGAIYAQGTAGPRDYRLAAQWFLKATKNGAGYGGEHYIAQCALVIMYAAGLGVEKDEKRAAFWLNRPNTRGADACHQM